MTGGLFDTTRWVNSPAKPDLCTWSSIEGTARIAPLRAHEPFLSRGSFYAMSESLSGGRSMSTILSRRGFLARTGRGTLVALGTVVLNCRCGTLNLLGLAT